MTVLDVGSEYINVDGQMVEKDALRVAEALRDYDENLSIICIDPNVADINDAPFIIAQKCPDGVLRRVFECWELNNTVLERIEASDTTRNDIQSYIEYKNAESRKESRMRYQEKRWEIKDIGASLLKNKKSSFTYSDPTTGEKVTIHENKPSERGDNAKSRSFV